MKQLIICIDGLPYDLFTEENMPFLYKYAKKNSFAKLKTLFAFTGLEYTFFTGKTPDETGIWLEFVKSNSIFDSKLINLFSFNKKLRDYSAVLVQLLNKRTWLSGLHNIPNDELKYFDTSVKDNLWELDFFNNKSFAVYKWPFFVTDKKKKLIFKYESDKKRLERLLKKNKDIYYVQLMSVDKIIHKFGKNHYETKRTLLILDNIFQGILEENIDKEIIIWSDHGFVDVKENIDLQSLLPKSEDYLIFYAGTTAHFWFENEKIKNKIINILKDLKCGFILTDTFKRLYKIPLSSKYGELIFVMKSGYYIHPNYYQTKPFKSMHGYTTDLDGVLITNRRLDKKEINIQDVLKWMI